jgi:hypothetical protein
MALSTRIGAAALGAVLALGLVGGATASHNIQRGVSLHYARKASFYATTPGYDSPTGALCRNVRSPVLDLG